MTLNAASVARPTRLVLDDAWNVVLRLSKAGIQAIGLGEFC